MLLKNESGSWSKMPAPSPVSGSQPHAPRWTRFSRICRPMLRIAWDASPRICATNPTPQASCSVAGSYIPLVSCVRWFSVTASNPVSTPAHNRRSTIFRRQCRHPVFVDRNQNVSSLKTMLNCTSFRLCQLRRFCSLTFKKTLSDY